MNESPSSGFPAPIAPEEYERVRAVFEAMKAKFARLAASLPAEARPAVEFLASGDPEKNQ
jgi:hypothetical protein